MKKPLTDSRRYRTFITDRDRFLEQILFNAQKDITLTLKRTLDQIELIVSHRYGMIPIENFFTHSAIQAMRNIESAIQNEMIHTSYQIAQIIMRLRKNNYLITYAASLEAIAQATGKEVRGHANSSILDQISLKDLRDDQKLLPRIQLALSRIVRDVIDSLELSRVMEESTIDAIIRMRNSAFPSTRRLKGAPKTLKRLQEASDPLKPDLRKRSTSTTFMDDDEWDDAIRAYQDNALPPTRFDNEPFVNEDGTKVYNWEIEQEVTHDFVTQVRNGEHDAAKDAGIKDFVWIAIVDDKTDECCLWRAGKTVTEIEAEMDQHDDECGVSVPPAHFNCRCRLAPVGDVPDEIESNQEDFDQWLNS